jgi:chromate transporter
VLRGNRNLTDALSGVTAAVVGVVLNLALVFGATVIWPGGVNGQDRLVRRSYERVAFGALYRFKAYVLWVVLAGGIIGLMRTVIFG